MKTMLPAAILGLALLASPARADDKPGDLDGDHAVTILDLCHLYDVIFGVAPASPLDDLNGDGQVNVGDIVMWSMHNMAIAVGDLNGDGSYDVVDLQYMILEVQSPDPDPAADLDGDGKVNVVDLLIEIQVVRKAMSFF